MDSKIRSYPSKDFGDGLNLCYYHGIVYQRDLTCSVEYSDDYFENYQRYENSPIADELNGFRVGIVERLCPGGGHSLLDIGIGCGTYLSRFKGYKRGYDINPKGVTWLQERGLYFDPYQDDWGDQFEAVTLWDVLEHMPNPDLFLEKVPARVTLFTSIPMFMDLWRLKESKHYKPDEHYYYFQFSGIKNYMADMGFEMIWAGDDESRIGRQQIMSFAFRRK